MSVCSRGITARGRHATESFTRIRNKADALQLGRSDLQLPQHLAVRLQELRQVVQQLAWLWRRPAAIDSAERVQRAGVTGRLVPTGDRKALGEAVRWTIKHRQKCRRMALESQDRCVRRFDASFMVAQLHRLYREVLGATSKG